MSDLNAGQNAALARYNFSQFLLSARKEKGLSIPDAAEAISVKASTGSAWEKGTSVPRAGKLEAVATAYDIPASEVTDRCPVSTSGRTTEDPIKQIAVGFRVDDHDDDF